MAAYSEEAYVKEITIRAASLSKLFSKWFRIENIERLADKRRLTERNITLIKEIWQALEEIYPGNGDIQFEIEPSFKIFTNVYGSNHVKDFKLFDKFTITKIYIVVRFPEISITNTRGEVLVIKDLFTRIPVKLSNGSRGHSVFETIEGSRSTMSMTEYDSDYRHSHLDRQENNSPNRQCNYTRFCTGSGDINSVTALLNFGFDIDTLKLLLFQIETFVKWESIEGTPYIRMKEVIGKNFDYPNIPLTNCISVYRYIKQTINDGYKLSLDWKFYNGRYSIVENEKLEKLFDDTCYSSFPSYFLSIDEQGKYFIEKYYDESIIKEYTTWLPFRGQKIHFKVEGQTRRSGTANQKFINPKVKYYVKSRLEYQANNSKIRESGTTRVSNPAYS